MPTLVNVQSMKRESNFLHFSQLISECSRKVAYQTHAYMVRCLWQDESYYSVVNARLKIRCISEAHASVLNCFLRQFVCTSDWKNCYQPSYVVLAIVIYSSTWICLYHVNTAVVEFIINPFILMTNSTFVYDPHSVTSKYFFKSVS